MDYDFNAPDVAHLEATHEPFFKLFRERNPKTPVVFVTHPFLEEIKGSDKERMAVVRKTYENALAAGDENVYFISGHDLMKYAKYDGLVDAAHPTDLGFMSMARAIIPVLKRALGK